MHAANSRSTRPSFLPILDEQGPPYWPPAAAGGTRGQLLYIGALGLLGNSLDKAIRD